MAGSFTWIYLLVFVAMYIQQHARRSRKIEQIPKNLVLMTKKVDS